jgi:hypothetical protein
MERIDTIPSLERQLELQQAYVENCAAGRAPYWHVHIRTHGELQWIMKIRNWNGEVAIDIHLEMAANDIYSVPPDLRDTNFARTNLAGVYLRQANLSNAILYETDLSGANLIDANLSGARLRNANCKNASFRHCNLQRAHCRSANFQQVDLSYASLEGTFLSMVDLKGANLIGSHMDALTVLSDAMIDSTTYLGDVLWNNVLMTRIDWSQVPSLGDESFLKNAEKEDKVTRIKTVRTVARAYDGLANSLRSQGMQRAGAYFRQRKEQLERQVLWLEHRYLSWFGSLLLDLVSGYGERPIRTFFTYLIVIFGFSTIYWGAANHLPTQSSTLNWYESIILSLSSFHGRGFFPSMISLGDPIAAIAAIEAVIGLFIELILIATFSRRFLGQ